MKIAANASSYDVYTGNKLLGNITLSGDKLVITGPEAGYLKRSMDDIKTWKKAKTDKEVFGLLRDIYRGQGEYLKIASVAK